MSAALWGITLLWAIVYIYGIAGSVDFGAGFWSMVFYRDRDVRASTIANRYLSPLWEVTNVFLVLFDVALVGLFPTAVLVLGNILLVPGGLILIFLTIRTVFMVYAHTIDEYQRPLRIVSGVTGLVIPALIMTIFPISEGGNFLVNVGGRLTLSPSLFLQTPALYFYILLGISSELFLSALILGDYALVGKDATAYRVYRKHALWLGPLNMAVALLTALSIARPAAWLERNMVAHWPWFVASGCLFIIGYALMVTSGTDLNRRFRWASVAIVAQYGCAMMGYGLAHLPYLVYPAVTINESFTNSAMFRAVIVVLILGLAVLFPGFVWFWRVFLANRPYATKP
ncbi:cytochrome d ubiquinol oxidase subunit II [Alicyclobacillus dauci]|uniref:Cytochrome d ubiquinol oxidase subunit II n=1 Tax=Alicyclobacillus dauci TaxID=1475485 RepID=A0ABY6Z5V3_9BACL|nr:cytochrome d ubiquinol oxidase subunit II [Alicyclobacillus dauci]WAH37571.1 cytochrome d ubiquinol oxidase subunit II [Alicyclobacillus dauci]